MRGKQIPDNDPGFFFFHMDEIKGTDYNMGTDVLFNTSEGAVLLMIDLRDYLDMLRSKGINTSKATAYLESLISSAPASPPPPAAALQGVSSVRRSGHAPCT